MYVHFNFPPKAHFNSLNISNKQQKLFIASSVDNF